MDSMQFISDLVIQFKDKKDPERNRVFYDSLTTFTNKCNEIHLQDVYNYIVCNHSYSTPFSVAKLYKYAEGKKFLIETKKERTEKTWLTCINCSTHYSTVGRGCPKCREKKATIEQAEEYPENYINVTEDCYYCTIYPDIKKNPKWMTFKDCGKYSIQQDPTCRPCQCKECCSQMKSYINDPRGTIEKYRTGELAQPWLMEVDPLNETVKQMVKDIAKRG